MAARLQQQGLAIGQQDQTHPWGGFFVLDESQAQLLADLYFAGLPVDLLRIAGQLSPKVLLVAPQQRLSWQYHHQRADSRCLLAAHGGLALAAQVPIELVLTAPEQALALHQPAPGLVIHTDRSSQDASHARPDNSYDNAPAGAP